MRMGKAALPESRLELADGLTIQSERVPNLDRGQLTRFDGCGRWTGSIDGDRSRVPPAPQRIDVFSSSRTAHMLENGPDSRARGRG